ncbi:MAG: histidine--tRNA ligase [Candidatus Liptonbacteria bacterium CG11_big_fil_rev_8_21_14_0_20_35_14]|uniref:Histidine--tRNA ligase n=1 Tax=Candidatus Liptonbacteria bacterium CG11_big_fil_rev_8_21_14_0_20_35_14 TaxID=1974634 RepID=A0A2H0N8K7_9BACT|nr:MAG: histidine--tRNA ligase [Candidatus Liptonbacteria bacterium CG11_big_fil_rev_8_21_14_0_20_35_14]
MNEKEIVIVEDKSKTRKKRPTFQSVKGMYEILPEEALWWDKVYLVVKEVAKFYTFKHIETGIIENGELFERAVGEENEVVQKEMFYIKSRTHNWVLRPENTASIVRAYLEYGFSSLPQPVKLFYFGPMFRHENPQAGRYRQFWQSGFEILGGENDPIFDAQIMLVAFRILKDLGLKDSIIKLNSVGCRVCQPNIKKKLSNFYRNNLKKIPKEYEDYINSNPLKILDSKKEEMCDLNEQAPVILDSLCMACRGHLKNLLEYLDETSLPYELDNTLVRGLDYYDKTVFEIFVPQSNNEKLAVCGGGRYDYLTEMLGGRPTPALGFAFGLERLISILKERKGNNPINREKKSKVFFIHVGEIAKKKSLSLVEMLRENNISVMESLSKDSMAKQLALADNEGIELVLIFGQKEVYEDSVIVKNLKSGIQETVLIKNMVDDLRKRF